MYLRNVRFAYAHGLLKATSEDGGDPKYSVVCLIPKNDKEQEAKIREEARKAAHAKFGAQLPKGMRHQLRDGDELDENGERVKGDEFKEHWYVSASSKEQPVVEVGKDHRPARPEEVVSGYYGDIQVGVFGYDKRGNKGVSCGINKVGSSAAAIASVRLPSLGRRTTTSTTSTARRRRASTAPVLVITPRRRAKTMRSRHTGPAVSIAGPIHLRALPSSTVWQ
jgi:ssDNA-binding protein